MSTTRSLGLHERYSVARRCVNSASIVTAVALLTLDSPTPQNDLSHTLQALERHLENRIEYALTQYPLLAHCVDSSRSRKPYYAPIVPHPTSKQILKLGDKIPAEQSEDVEGLFAQTILDQEKSLLASTKLDQGPLWSVLIRHIEGTADSPPGCLVALSTDHVVNDGRGTLNLLRLLLSPQTPAFDPSLATTLPPASDKLFDFTPSLAYFLNIFVKELVIPNLPLPSSWKAKLLGPVAWPASPLPGAGVESQLARSPKTCEPALSILLLSAPKLITNLKQLAKRHIGPKSGTKKAATLHAVVHTLALVALYAALAAPHHYVNWEQFEVLVKSSTPISLRDDSPAAKGKRFFTLSPAVEASSSGLPATSGNFVSSYSDDYRLHPKQTFWGMTNAFATSLASREGRDRSRWHLGMLKYIPDFDNSHKPGFDAEYVNGWEKFFHSRIHSDKPYEGAFTVSNLGLVELSSLGIDCEGGKGRWRVRKVSWAQSHTPMGEAFGVDIVGFTTGEAEESLSLGISSRPTAFRDEGLYERFIRYLRRLVLAFAEDEEGEAGRRKFSQETGREGLDLREDLEFSALARWLIQSDDQIA